MRIVVAVAYVLVNTVLAWPVPAPQVRAKPQAVPELPCETRWGGLVQNGRGVSVQGNATWEALGRIRDDGSLYLLWVYKPTGRKAPSVYKIGAERIAGDWGWEEDVVERDDGTLGGGNP